jgi:hypothetical protein
LLRRASLPACQKLRQRVTRSGHRCLLLALLLLRLLELPALKRGLLLRVLQLLDGIRPLHGFVKVIYRLDHGHSLSFFKA